MNWTHVHLLLNHFPTVGMIVGLGVFFYGLFARSVEVKRASFVIFFGIALLSIPTFVTGTAAELAFEKNPDIPKGLVQQHENAAFFALAVMELTGVLAWLGLYQYRRLARLPQATVVAVLLTGLVTLGMMSRAADFGGEIRHAEIRTEPLPPDPVEDAPAATLTRAIGDGMVNLKWGWPACETIHFIGLSMLFGVVLIIDLRMLGFMTSIPFATLHRLLPWGILGFALNTATGMLFFVGAPTNFYVTNPWFFYKLGMILIAGANALYFTVLDETWTLKAGDPAPFTAKVAAASGIALWLGVIFCGQMLPFLGHSF